MTTSQQWLLGLNIMGGMLVLGSYVIGFRTHPGAAQKLWGGIPASIRPWYALSMLMAAAGYFAFLYYLLFAVDPSAVPLPCGSCIFFAILTLVLIPSSCWMPLTFSYETKQSPLIWCAVRAVLILAAIGSLALVLALLLIRPEPVTVSWILAFVGAAIFAFHLTVLDALIWPALFRKRP